MCKGVIPWQKEPSIHPHTHTRRYTYNYIHIKKGEGFQHKGKDVKHIALHSCQSNERDEYQWYFFTDLSTI